MNYYIFLLAKAPSFEYIAPDSQKLIISIMGLLQFIMIPIGVVLFFPSLILLIANHFSSKKEGKHNSQDRFIKICFIVSVLCIILVPVFGLLRYLIETK